MGRRRRLFLIVLGFVLELASLGLVIFGFPYFFKLKIWQIKERVSPDEALVVYFNQPVLISSLKNNFKIEPPVKGSVILDDWRRRFVFKTTQYLDPHQTYQIKFNRVRSLSMSSVPDTQFSFFVEDIFADTQKASAVVLPVVRPREPESGCNPQGPQILFDKYIDVDLAKKKIWLYEDGWCLAEYQVHKHGSPSMPTPRGQFKVLTKERNHFSSSAHVWMPWSMHFYGGSFLHGIPYFPDGRILQGAYSHGCIQIPTDQAEKIYQFAEIGIPVLVHD